MKPFQSHISDAPTPREKSPLIHQSSQITLYQGWVEWRVRREGITGVNSIGSRVTGREYSAEIKSEWAIKFFFFTFLKNDAAMR